MAQPPPAAPSAEALKQGYEPEGMHFWTAITSLVVLALVVAVIMGVAALTILDTTRDDRALDVPRSAVAAPPIDTGLPPLQPTPSHDTTAAEDLIVFRQHEDEVFAQMGWKMGADRKRQVPDDILAKIAAKQASAKGGR